MALQLAKILKASQLGSRQRIKIALALTEPFSVDQLLTHGVHEFVSGTNGSVANTCYRGYLFRRLRLTHKMRGRVDARCCNGQRRATGERADFVSLLRNIL